MKKATPAEQLHALVEFRKDFSAPVDTVGCSKVGDKNDVKLYRFQTLIGLMLSAQTKDEITAQAVEYLKDGLEGGLTPSTLGKANIDTVAELIRKVSFYKTKAGRIIEAAKICERDYDNDIPRSMKDLTALKGVGIKMATLAMGHAWHELVGIGVDVHVHRIANRLHWVHTKNPDQTELELQKLFPKDLWEPVNETIVGLGQTICGAIKQRCEKCPITESCPHFNGVDDTESEEETSSRRTKKKKGNKKEKKKVAPKQKAKPKQKKRATRKKAEDIEDIGSDSESESEASLSSDYVD